jgi:hypothetical protein
MRAGVPLSYLNDKIGQTMTHCRLGGLTITINCDVEENLGCTLMLEE